MSTKASRPYRLMIFGLAFIIGITLLQRLAVAAFGISADTEGYQTVQFICWVIGGVPFIIGFTMMAHGIVTNDQDHKDE